MCTCVSSEFVIAVQPLDQPPIVAHGQWKPFYCGSFVLDAAVLYSFCLFLRGVFVDQKTIKTSLISWCGGIVVIVVAVMLLIF